MNHKLKVSEDGSELRFTTASFEVRADGDEKKPKIVGYAAVFNKRSVNLGFSDEFPWYEVIEPGAFSKVLTDDVRAVIDHEGGLQTLGRTKSGTLKISEDEIGLRFELEPPDTAAGRDIVTLIQRGDIDQASFKFQIADGGDKYTDEDDGKTTIRTILAGGISRLMDVSPVTFPAYPDTVVTSRSVERVLTDKRRRPGRTPLKALELRLASREKRYNRTK